MNTRNSFVRLLYIAAVFLLAACQKTGEDPTPQPRPKTYAPEDQSVRGRTEQTETTSVAFQPQVIEVRKDIQEASIQSPSNNEMHFNITPATEQIRVGDVLYSSGIQEGTPCYARKVKRVQKSNGKIVCEVTQASIDEVFQELEQKDSLVFSDTGIVTYDIESQLNDNTTPSVARTRGSYKPIPGSDLVKIKVEWIPDRQEMRPTIELEVIVIDRDKNYKTTHDQIRFSAALEFTEFSNHTSYKDGTLSFTGNIESKAEFGLEYGYSKKDPLNGKDYETFLLEEALKTVSKPDKLLKKRILLGTVPIKQIPAGKLSIGFSLDLYLILELDLEGKIRAKFECSPITISYNASLSLSSGLNLNAKVCDPIKPKFRNIDIKGSLTATGKLRLPWGFVFKIPAFPMSEDSDEPNLLPDPSYAALFVEPYFDLKATMEARYKSGSKGGSYFKGGIGMGAFLDLYLEAEAKLWFFKIEERYDFFKQPLSLWKGLEMNLGSIWIYEGNTMKFTPLYPNTRMEEEALITTSNNHAKLKIKDDGDLSFSGNSAGTTHFVIEYPPSNKRMDFYSVYVLKNTYSADSTYIKPSKGEQL